MARVASFFGPLVGLSWSPEDREKKKEESYVSDDIRKTVALAKQFKELVDCLGDRVQAALIVPEFKVFLKPAEKTEYDEKAKSDESSD